MHRTLTGFPTTAQQVQLVVLLVSLVSDNLMSSCSHYSELCRRVSSKRTWYVPPAQAELACVIARPPSWSTATWHSESKQAVDHRNEKKLYEIQKNTTISAAFSRPCALLVEDSRIPATVALTSLPLSRSIRTSSTDSGVECRSFISRTLRWKELCCTYNL